MSTGTSGTRGSVASGLLWNTLYQVFNTLLSFGAMLVMVRLLSPGEYGRAAAAVALISIASAFGSPSFVAHSLQLPEGEQPDWGLHWNVSMPLQLLLFVILNVIAFGCWLSDTYYPIAGLIVVGAIGVLLEWPAQIAGYSLRRELDFRRLRILQGVSGAVNSLTMIGIAALGGGAYALIIANNVLPAAALALDLLLLRKWRPGTKWWTRPDLRSYADAARFGFQNLGSSLLVRSRAGLEGLVLPAATGFAQIGIMNRGAALHGLTVARVEGIILETVYPLLPRAAGDDARFRRIATLYCQCILLTTACGTVFVGIMGPSLSRLLYGPRWIAADPFIWPAAIVGFGITACSLGVNVLLARGRLRATVILNGIGAAIGLPMIMIAVWRHSLLPYMWALAVTQVLVAAVDIVVASRYLEKTWRRDLVYPAVVVTGVSAAALLAAHATLMNAALLPRVLAAAALYMGVGIVTTRIGFPALTSELLRRLPAAQRTLRLFRLQAETP